MKKKTQFNRIFYKIFCPYACSKKKMGFLRRGKNGIFKEEEVQYSKSLCYQKTLVPFLIFIRIIEAYMLMWDTSLNQFVINFLYRSIYIVKTIPKCTFLFRYAKKKSYVILHSQFKSYVNITRWTQCIQFPPKKHILPWTSSSIS